jgi:hypothetical protein
VWEVVEVRLQTQHHHVKESETWRLLEFIHEHSRRSLPPRLMGFTPGRKSTSIPTYFLGNGLSYGCVSMVCLLHFTQSRTLLTVPLDSILSDETGIMKSCDCDLLLWRYYITAVLPVHY